MTATRMAGLILAMLAPAPGFLRDLLPESHADRNLLNRILARGLNQEANVVVGGTHFMKARP